MSEHLRVPKRRAWAELALCGRSPCRVEIFLAASSVHTPRPERVSDVLDAQTPFLPVCDDGRPVLVGRAALLWVAVPTSSLEDDELELFAFRRKVLVDLVDGTHIEGELLYTSPSDNARVGDFLNEESRFFRVWSESRTYFVTKQHVIRVLEL